MGSQARLRNTETSVSPLPSVPSGDIDVPSGDTVARKSLETLEGSPWLCEVVHSSSCGLGRAGRTAGRLSPGSHWERGVDTRRRLWVAVDLPSTGPRGHRVPVQVHPAGVEGHCALDLTDAWAQQSPGTVAREGGQVDAP